MSEKPKRPLSESDRERLIESLVPGSSMRTPRTNSRSKHLLGPLPPFGLTDTQLEMVRKIVEVGNHGLKTSAEEIQIAKVALRARLQHHGLMIGFKSQFRLRPREDGRPDFDVAIRQAILAEPVEENCTDERKVELVPILFDEAQRSLPFVRGVALTVEQGIALKKLLHGLDIGVLSACRAFGVSQRMMAWRLPNAGLRVEESRQFRLVESAALTPNDQISEDE